MKLGDTQVRVTLRCALCFEPVQTGIKHICNFQPSKENKNVKSTT